MDQEEHTKLRAAILSNAEGFIRAAHELDGKSLEHVRYHLAVMALEEVGKANLVGMRFVAKVAEVEKEPPFGEQLDDHIKKLFWALWGGSFVDEKLSPEQFYEFQGLAQRIHDKRLASLYTDANAPLAPSERMSVDEANTLVGLAESRLALESLRTSDPIDDSKIEVVRWFLAAGNNPELRSRMFGSQALNKLREFNGDVSGWVGWLRENIAKDEAEMRALAERELKRSRPEATAEELKPKYRVRLTLYSHSHSIKQKALNSWNAGIEDIKLRATGQRIYSRTKKDELKCEFILREGIPPQALWYAAWGMSRAFVVSLNIGTRGFFWWHVPNDTSVFYDDITDLEHNVGLKVEPQFRLEIGWGNLALRESDLTLTSVIFGYVLSLRGTEKEFPLNKYVEGLAALSKIDIHFRLEANTFQAFWQSLRDALRINGDWDVTADYVQAAVNALTSVLKTTDDFRRYIELGATLETLKSPASPPQITLTEVIGMKLYCDLYLTIQAQKWAANQQAGRS